MTEEQFKKLFKSKKSYAKLAESTTICLIETAIVHGKMTIEEFANKPLGEIKDILFETIKGCTNENEEFNSTIDYTEGIVQEAKVLKNKKNYRLALVLYATTIEHHLNDIIHKSLISKNFHLNEIENIMRLDIEAKRTWLFPLLGLPRLSKDCSKYIKTISDKRNEFVHYKWKGSFEKEFNDKDKEYENLCKKAISTISYIKRFKTQNLITHSKIKRILDNKKMKN